MVFNICLHLAVCFIPSTMSESRQRLWDRSGEYYFLQSFGEIAGSSIGSNLKLRKAHPSFELRVCALGVFTFDVGLFIVGCMSVPSLGIEIDLLIQCIRFFRVRSNRNFLNRWAR